MSPKQGETDALETKGTEAMEKIKHSPEPWQVSSDGLEPYRLRSADTCGVNTNEDTNAARIVACVNALASMEPSALASTIEAFERLIRVAAVELDKVRPDVMEQSRAALAKLRDEN